MVTLTDLMSILERGLREPQSLGEAVHGFMKVVDLADDEELSMSDDWKEIVRDLAYDLAFFVADPEARA